MIKFILILMISFNYLLSYDNEDRYTKLHGWSLGAGYTTFKSLVEIRSKTYVDTYFTFDGASNTKAGADDTFLFVESQRNAIDIDVFDDKLYYNFIFELSKSENNVQGYLHTGDAIGNLGTLVTNEAYLFTPTLYFPFATFDNHFFTFSAGIGIGHLRSIGEAQQILVDLNGNYGYGKTYNWNEAFFAITRNIDLSYDLFLNNNTSLRFSWIGRKIKAYESDKDLTIFIKGYRLYCTFKFATD